MMSSLPASTLTVPVNTDCSTNNTNASRRLSQTITDIVTGSTPAGRSRSSSSPPSPIKFDQGPNKISIQFDGGGQIIVRPNRTVRGRLPFYIYIS